MTHPAIDMHAHHVPAALAERLRERITVPRLQRSAYGGERLVTPTGTLAHSEHWTDLSLRVELMDRCGIERQLLSLPSSLGIDGLPSHEAGPLVRLFNDECARACRRYPRRFAGLAALPLADVDAAVAELERTRRDLGLAGAILPAGAFASEDEAWRLRPLFEAADALAAHVLVHPGPRPGAVAVPSAPADHDLARQALDEQHALGHATVTLLLSGLLDDLEHVTVQVASLGGTFPAVVERMDHATLLRDPGRTLPSARARRVWVDCATLGARAIAQAIAVFGEDRLLLGTDGPVFDAGRSLLALRQVPSTADRAERNARMLLDRHP